MTASPERDGAGRVAAAAPRILLITDRVPGNDTGYGMRVANVIDGLRSVGDLHVCLVDSSYGGASLPVDDGYSTVVVRADNPRRWQKLLLALTRIPNLPYRRERRLRAELRRRIGRHPWDAVWCSRVRTHHIADGVVEGPRILDFDDLTDRLILSEIEDRTSRFGRVATAPRNLASRLAAPRWRGLQLEAAGRVEAVTVCSEDDRRYLGVDNAVVVPNGYRTPRHAERAVDVDAPTMFFVGPLSYEPNRLAVDWFAFDVLPRIRRQLPNARLLAAGYNHGVPDSLRHADGVTLLGYVHDLGAYYSAAAVAVTPLRSGGGTRLKVIEALARSVPLVSTSFGCAGLPLTHESELLIADDADSFAAACVRLVRDQQLAARLAAAGLRRFEQQLTSENSSRAVADVTRSVIRQPSAATPPRRAR